MGIRNEFETVQTSHSNEVKLLPLTTIQGTVKLSVSLTVHIVKKKPYWLLLLIHIIYQSSISSHLL